MVRVEYYSDIFQVRGACAREEYMMHLNKTLCECIGTSILKPPGA